ncbi:unnamed protein product, partial [Arabidopsis halleri]
DFPGPDFLTFIDLWVQVRGIPLPYVSELTVSFIANTLGPVMELDFNEETTTCITFIRVKVRICFTDRLRFFRRVRFESREGAMIGSNNVNPPSSENSLDSSDISSYSPISQPSPPASPALHENEFNVPPPPNRYACSRSTSPPDSSSEAQVRGKAKYEIGESSKRKKGKEID